MIQERHGELVGYRKRPKFGDRYHVKSTRTAPTETLTLSRELRLYPILQFWALSVNFKISIFDVFRADALIIDCRGTKCGILNMHGFEDDQFFQLGTAYKFILVSESNSCRDPKCGYGFGLTIGLASRLGGDQSPRTRLAF
jgi:hypothetical protein